MNASGSGSGGERPGTPPRSPVRPVSPTASTAPSEQPGSSAAALIAHVAENRASSPHRLSPTAGSRRRGTPPSAAAQLPAADVEASSWITGWVTLRKEGRKLVSSRVRVEPWVRQRAGLLWKAQQVTDKLELGLEREIAMLDPTGVGFAFGGVTPGWMLSKGNIHTWHKVHFTVGRAGRYLLHVRLRDVKQPLPGSPFALTVVPGDAHATRVFLLPDAQPLRGEVGMEDPYKDLVNKPPAHERQKASEAKARQTNNTNSNQYGCRLVIRTADRSGNMCIKGGAKVEVTCPLVSVQTNVEDRGDGTYLLTWMSTESTLGVVTTKVEVNGAQCRNSPMRLQLLSSRPERGKTEVKSCGSEAEGVALMDRVVQVGKVAEEPEEELFNGVGLRHAVAGQKTSIFLRFRDEYGNLATPPERYKVGMALSHSRGAGDGEESKSKSNKGESRKKAIDDVEPYEDVESMRGPEDSGWHTLTYVPKTAGLSDLFLWCEPEGNGVREPLPGSPFQLHVTANVAVASQSFIDGFAAESRKEKEKGGAGGNAKGGAGNSKPSEKAGEVGTAAGTKSRSITAGDVAIVRLYGVDAFGNSAMPATLAAKELQPAAANAGDQFLTLTVDPLGVPATNPTVEGDSSSAFDAKIVAPGHAKDAESPNEVKLVVVPQAKAGRAAFETRHECVMSGDHAVHVQLNGEPIVGSPLIFAVVASTPTTSHSTLTVPDNSDRLFAHMDEPSTVILRTCDKFGNACTTGGLRVAGYAYRRSNSMPWQSRSLC